MMSRASASGIRVSRHRSRLPLVFFLVMSSSVLMALRAQHGGWPTMEDCYRSVVIFSGNGAWAFDKSTGKGAAGLLVRLFATLAPIVTALGVGELAIGWFDPAVVRANALLHRGRRSVALFGLDANSLTFAQALKADGYQPRIYVDLADEQFVELACSAWIPVYPAHRRWLGGVRRLPSRVTDVVSFLPAADAQVTLAQRVPSPARGQPPRLWLLAQNRGFAQRLEDYLATKTASGPPPRLIDPETIAARALLTLHPLDLLADALDQQRIHIAIYGFGRLGRAVAREAARLYVTRPALQHARLRITIVDRQVAAARLALLAESPGIENIVELQAQQAALDASGFALAQVGALVPEDVTAHVVTVGDAEAAFACAVSLRRWLLEPPDELGRRWSSLHPLAPIFVRTRDWSGSGQLIRTPAEHADGADMALPDGIFGFAAREQLWTTQAILAPEREAGARAVHETYYAMQHRLPLAGRAALADWAWLQPRFRESNFQVYDHLAIKARAVGFRIVPANTVRGHAHWPGEDARRDDLMRLEHLRYLAERGAGGWRYAASRCDAVGVHPDLVAWNEMPAEELRLDAGQIDALPHIASAAGKCLAEALVIGVTGHRADRPGLDADHVKRRLHQTLEALVAANPGRAPLLLTALATGTDRWAAEAALALGIPYQVPLPLPYELYTEDFRTENERRQFRELIAQAEYYIELPLRFGRASALTSAHEPTRAANKPRRDAQYALAGAYIAERAHHLVCVWDGCAAAGEGGTAQVASWIDTGVPATYRTVSRFFLRPGHKSKTVISPAHDQ